MGVILIKKGGFTLDKDQFSKKYGFYSYEEMLSESGTQKDKDETKKHTNTFTLGGDQDIKMVYLI